VQDEDDTSKLIRLPFNHVMRLSTGLEGCFKKGSDCMAIFPETTSFYRAKVAKDPVWKLDHHHSTPSGNSSTGVVPAVKEVIVKFEDDDDPNTGKTPHRRVPARYVIPMPSRYFYEEQDDVDLTPPQTLAGSGGGGGGGGSGSGSGAGNK
jgi:SAGA-associated factor 29